MRLARGMRSSRLHRRRAALAATTSLLLAGAVACGPAEGATGARQTVVDSVDLMTAEEAASVVVTVDAPASEVRTLLAEFGQDGGEGRAERLARAEVAVALVADKPLNRLEKYRGRTRLAVALGFGDKDVLGYKSVGKSVYLRLQLKELAQRGSLTAEQRERVDEILGMADDLPRSLRAVERLLKGGWVRLDPQDFADYGWAVEEFTGLSLGRTDVRGVSSVLDGRELRAALGGLEDVLTGHATVGRTTGDDGTQRIAVELPARRTAKELAPLLRPLGAALDPADVPERRIPAQLVVRRGSLAELRIDLGALTEGGTAEVPLRLRFSPGDVFSATTPEKSLRLEPQDLLTAALYGSLQGS